jgi:hypothetical protein
MQNPNDGLDEYRKIAAERYKRINPNYKTEKEKQLEHDEEMARKIQLEEQEAIKREQEAIQREQEALKRQQEDEELARKLQLEEQRAISDDVEVVEDDDDLVERIIESNARGTVLTDPTPRVYVSRSNDTPGILCIIQYKCHVYIIPIACHCIVI